MEIPRSADEQVKTDLALYLDAADENVCVIAFRELPFWGRQWTRESLERGCPVRVELEHVVIFGTVQDARALVRNKNSWGQFLRISALLPDDELDPTRIVYQHKASSPARMRFECRQVLKKKLGKEGRGLVKLAMHFTKRLFLLRVSRDEEQLLWERLGVSAIGFWRLCRNGNGRSEMYQAELPFSLSTNRSQQPTELSLYRQTLKRRMGQSQRPEQLAA